MTTNNNEIISKVAMSTSVNKKSATMSDYERQRAINIQKNNARLRELGLISAMEEEESNALAWNRRVTKPLIVNEPYENKDKNKKRKRNTASKTSSSLVSRKSLRLEGKEPDGGMLIESGNDDKENIKQQRQERVMECRMVRLKLANLLANQTDAQKKAAKKNPTASYEHCLMRIKTMNDKALRNRVKAIERAAGRHSVIKMGIFYQCLQEHDLWELADLAGAALERLKELKPPDDTGDV